MNYNFSYGLELEISDIDRTIDIPDSLGSWEGPKVNGMYMGAEIDVVNTLPPYSGVGSDPLGETCPVGGEINVVPSITVDGQIQRVSSIFDLFSTKGIGQGNHFHVHIHSNIFNDFNTLKNIALYSIKHQNDLIEKTYYCNIDIVKNANKFGYDYCIQDGGRLLDFSIDDVNKCKDINDLNKLFSRTTNYRDPFTGKVHKHTSKRAAINLYNLVNGKTIEFRCFRGTLDLYEIYCELQLVTRFLEEASVNSDVSVLDIISENNYMFAKTIYDAKQEQTWIKTRHSKDRGDKYKYYYKSFKEPNDDIKNKIDMKDLHDKFKKL